ncbi:unnamed protein product, partial [marine sediment metagenome]
LIKWPGVKLMFKNDEEKHLQELMEKLRNAGQSRKHSYDDMGIRDTQDILEINAEIAYALYKSQKTLKRLTLILAVFTGVLIILTIVTQAF